MTSTYAALAAALVFASGAAITGIAVSGIAISEASAQTRSGSEGDGGTPRSIGETPDLSSRKIVERGPKAEDGEQRSLAQPSEEEFRQGFTTVVRSKDGSQKTVEPSEELKTTIIRALKGGDTDAAAPKTGDDPIYDEAERTIVGEDDRVRISDTTAYPFRTIGQLYSVDGDGNWSTCSATLISSSAVLTAAHCVYDHETGGWLEDYEFYPALNGRGRAPYGKFSWTDAYILEGFITNWKGYYGSVVPWDLAVVMLDQPVGSNLGWMGYSVYDPAYAFTANIVGYPGDMPDGTMWRASCDVDPDLADATNMDYECDTWPGSSGSSVYDYNPDTTERAIYGVNIASSPDINTGIRLNWAYFSWVAEHAGD